jgi:hypothetical protein
VTGAIAALSPKRPATPPGGTLYSRSLTVVVASAAWLAALCWPQDAYLLVLGTLALAAATLGRTARRRQWRWQRWRWVRLHLTGICTSYILLLTAFYVDNGKHLPIWQRLPHLAYWLVPSAVGLPLVARALTRHRGLAPHRPTPIQASPREVDPQPQPQPRVMHQPPCRRIPAPRWPRPAGATAPAAVTYSRLPSPSRCRSARRLIAASQLRRIAPLAGRISHQ